MDNSNTKYKVEVEALKSMLSSPSGQIVLNAWKREYIYNPIPSTRLTDTQIRYKLSQRELIQSFIDLLNERSDLRQTQV